MKRARRGGPQVEQLQDRITPTAYLVNNLADSGAGSLRQAIIDSNANAGADTISFTGAGASGTITLTTGQLPITDDVTITGPGSAQLTISGNSASRIFNVDAASLKTVSISSLTLDHGLVSGSNRGGAIYNNENLTLDNVVLTNNQAGGGGAIENFFATLTIRNSTLANNTATSASDSGGAIRNFGSGTSLTIINSTISGNVGPSGGGIGNNLSAVATISNCTFSGNSSSGSLGGAIFQGGGAVTVSNSTFTGNSAAAGGAIDNQGTTTLTNVTIAGNTGTTSGGGIRQLSTLRAINTIISGNTSPSSADLSGSISSGSNNLVGSATVNLQSLASNGGPTQTRALGSGSSAIDAGASSLTTLSAAATNSDTTLTVVSSTFLQVGQLYRIGAEIVKVQTVPSSTSVTVLRSQDGTSAVAFANGATIDLAYDQRGFGNPRNSGAAVDVGAYEVQPASLTPSLSSGNLVVTDGNNVANAVTFVVSGSNLVITDAVEQFASNGGISGSSLSNGNRTLTVPFASITGSSITLNGAGGNDALTVDLSGGAFGKTVIFNGGSGTSDSLVISGGNQGTVTYNFTNANDGSVVMSSFGAIEYTGLEPITNTGVAADIVFNLPAGPNSVTLGDDGTSGNGLSRLSGATFELTNFANPTNSLTINRGNAADTITVNSLPDFTASMAIGASVNTFSTISFNGAVTLGSGKNLSAYASGTINLPNAVSDIATTGSGSLALTTARDIVLGSGSSLTTVDGDLTLNANQQGSQTSGAFVGIDVNGSISSGAGNLTVKGRGGNSTSDNNVGVRLNGAGTQISSGGGAVLVQGTGGGTGASNFNLGVSVANGGITNTGTGAGAAVTVKGFGGDTTGTGFANYGVSVGGASGTITSNGGAVLVEGTGGGGSSSSVSYGIDVESGGTITSAGTSVAATVTIKGVGGASNSSSAGVWVSGTNSKITSSGGAVEITATSPLNNHAVNLNSGGMLGSGGGATLTVIADSFRGTGPGAINSGAGATTLKPRTAGTPINLGGADLWSPLTLGLTDAELDFVTAGTLVIGDASSGPITVSAGITRPTGTAVALISNGDISISGGSIDTNNGTLTLTPGASASVKPNKSGNDVSASTIAFTSGRDLLIDLAGTAVDTQYTQFNVVGSANLTGADLLLTGAYVPVVGNVFTIVSATSVTGAFNGYGNGSYLLRNGVQLRVDYTATTVTLTAAPIVTNVAPFIGPTSGGVVVIITGTNFSAIDPGHLASAVKFGAGNTFTDALSYTVNSNTQITAVAPAGTASTVNVVVTSAGVSSADDSTGGTTGTANDYTFATPVVTSVVVNGGQIVARNVYNATPALAGQQSVVAQLLVTFNQRVRLDADAFNISSLAASVTASVATPSMDAVAVNSTPVVSTGNGVDGYTQYVLTFAAGAGVNSYNNGVSPGLGNAFTTIKDGLWQLNVTGAKVHAGLSDTAANAVASKFWALYSAVNSQDVTVSTSIGDGQSKLLSDGVALGEMYAAFGSFQNQSGPPFYNTSYDANLDGIVDGIDLGKMYANFGAIWQF